MLVVIAERDVRSNRGARFRIGNYALKLILAKIFLLSTVKSYNFKKSAKLKIFLTKN